MTPMKPTGIKARQQLATVSRMATWEPPSWLTHDSLIESSVQDEAINRWALLVWKVRHQHKLQERRFGSKLLWPDPSNSLCPSPGVGSGDCQEKSSQRTHVLEMPSVSNLPRNQDDGRGTNTNAKRATSRWTTLFCLSMTSATKLDTSLSEPSTLILSRQLRTDLVDIGCGRDSQRSRGVLTRMGTVNRVGLWNGCTLATRSGAQRLLDQARSQRQRHCWITPPCCELSIHPQLDSSLHHTQLRKHKRHLKFCSCSG